MKKLLTLGSLVFLASATLYASSVGQFNDEVLDGHKNGAAHQYKHQKKYMHREASVNGGSQGKISGYGNQNKGSGKKGAGRD